MRGPYSILWVAKHPEPCTLHPAPCALHPEPENRENDLAGFEEDLESKGVVGERRVMYRRAPECIARPQVNLRLLSVES